MEGNTATDMERRIYASIYPGLAGTCGALSVLFAKSAAEVVSNGMSQLGRPETYVFILLLGVCVFLQLRFLNVGLSKAGARARHALVRVPYVSPVLACAVMCRCRRVACGAHLPSVLGAWLCDAAHRGVCGVTMSVCPSCLQVFFNVISGMIYFQEYHHMSYRELFMFYLGSVRVLIFPAPSVPHRGKLLCWCGCYLVLAAPSSRSRASFC